MNEITKYIPDEAAISDQLAEMDEEDRSIIKWALLNNADDLRDYCYVNEDGELKGDFSEFFKQAIDIEGTFKTQGKHAAGVVISAEPLYKVCPMVNQRSGGEKNRWIGNGRPRSSGPCQVRCPWYQLAGQTYENQGAY